jgi:alkylation response protein AidB-like acyl-CoA dehydrogenase
VNLAFTEDQEALRASARQVLAAEAPMSVVREVIDDPDRWRSLWTTVAALGWPALCLPGPAGGLDGDVVSLVGLLEVAGEALLPAPLLSTAGLAAPLLLAGGAGPDLLAEVAGGAVATAAVHRADGSVDAAPPATWDGHSLQGQAGFVPDGARASLIVVLAGHDGRPVLAAVRSGAGVDVVAAASVDPTRPLAEIRLDVPGERVALLPGDPGRGLDTARTAVAADLVGVAARALARTVEHVRTREQFGRPIGAFQAVKHRLADAYVAVERARSLTYRAAMLLDDPDAAGVPVAAALAKAAASEAAVLVAKAGVQLHGAVGMTWEHDMHLFLRRARQGALLLGDARHHYRRAASRHLSGDG